MGFVALKPMDLGNGRRAVVGDPLPEVEQWANPGPWVRRGYVACVADGKEAEFKAALLADPSRAARFLLPVNESRLRMAARRMRSQSGAGTGMQDVPPSSVPAPAAPRAAAPTKQPVVNPKVVAKKDG